MVRIVLPGVRIASLDGRTIPPPIDVAYLLMLVLRFTFA